MTWPQNRSLAAHGIALLALSGATACSQPRRDPTNTSRDSLVAELRRNYQQDLAKFLRDSSVVDSIARTIPMDSLKALYLQYLTVPDPWPAYLRLTCAGTALRLRYGAPAEYANRWLRDSLFRLYPREAARAERRLPSSGIVSSQGCQPSERGPDVVNGTNLRFTPRRPEPVP